MLLNHPAIKRAHVRDDFSLWGRPYKTLVVETDIPIPKLRTYADTTREFENLVEYIASVKKKKLQHVQKLEIKPYKENNTQNSDIKTHA